MQIGAIFPQTEIGADPKGIKAYVQAIEEMGYDYLVAYDHVLGVDKSIRPDWVGVYDSSHMFHEPMVLFGYIAALTERIGLVSSVIILGQRQTALLAKQAAEVDVLTGGRLRLGVGIGWNAVEYEALGANFHDRGRRSEEQVELLRRLWTEQHVTFEGKWHRVTAAGINPLPVQRPIPLWFGGRASQLMERIGRVGDGWFPLGMDPKGDDVRVSIDLIKASATKAGRDPNAIGIEGSVRLSNGTISENMELVDAWRKLGASHLSFNTMNVGLQGPDAHMEIAKQFMQAIGR